MHSGVCWHVEEMLLGMSFQQLLRWRMQSGKSGVNPEDQYRSGNLRRGPDAAAGNGWSLRSAEEEPLVQKLAEIPRTEHSN